MRCTGLLVVLALAIGCAAAAQESPPEFSYELYSDKQGHFSYDGAALALVKRPSHLQRVYADAAKWGEALNGAGNFKILQVELPTSTVDQTREDPMAAPR